MTRFFKCPMCGSVVAKLNQVGCTPSCCGKPMVELIAGVTDAAKEKHVPVIEIDNSHVRARVGEVAHPMTEAHLIEWIYFETTLGGTFRFLKAEDKPEAEIVLAEGEKLVAVYAYCNLHGLWKAN